VIGKKNINVFLLVFALAFTACKSTYTLSTENKGQLVDYSAAKPDSGLQQMLGPYSKTYHSTMNEVVGYLADDMEKGFPEGKLGHFMADIFLDLALAKGNTFTADNTIALFNNGGLRVPLQKGAVTRGKVFELMPFENQLVGVQLKGSVLVNELATYLYTKKGQPISRNLYIVFKGDRLVKMEINGRAVDTIKQYIVLTSDYLSGGGDNMEFFKKGTEVKEVPFVKLRDGIIDYFQQHSSPSKPVQAPTLGRIKME